MSDNAEFLQRILSAFRNEAEEIITGMTSALLDLEKSTDSIMKQDILEQIYRQAHTLKGAARAVDSLEVESICQEMENVFSAFKSGNATFSITDLDIMHKAIETIQKSLASRINGSKIKDYEINEILQNLRGLLSTEPLKDEPVIIDEAVRSNQDGLKLPKGDDVYSQVFSQSFDEEHQPETETIRIATHKLDNILLQVEDMLSIKLSSTQLLKDIQRLAQNYRLWEQRIREVEAQVDYLQKNLEERRASDQLRKDDKALQLALKYLYS